MGMAAALALGATPLHCPPAPMPPSSAPFGQSNHLADFLNRQFAAAVAESRIQHLSAIPNLRAATPSVPVIKPAAVSAIGALQLGSAKRYSAG